MRILLNVEYDGTNYAGWQRQNNAITVQQVLEEAIERAMGQQVSVTGAGRTDSGVHAVGQCAHFDIETTIPPDKIAYALNLVLPEDIRIRESRRVKEDFHARKSAVGKHYRYLIFNNPHDCAINRHYCAHVRYPLDVEAMKNAVKYIQGTHDFACFQAAGSTEMKSTVRTVTEITVKKVGDYIYIDVKGTGFLYNMVRIIVGTLLEVGRGRRKPESIIDTIASCSRESAGPTAPAKGLTMVSVFYPQNLLILKKN